MATEMKKAKVKMIKPLYLGMSILDISKTLMYEFWYGYIRPKYGDKAKLCYTDTDSFVIHTKTEDFFQDISNDVERYFDTSNYDENDKRPHPVVQNENVPGPFKDELEGKIITEVLALRAKTYAYLIDGYDDVNDDKIKIINKKAKRKKKCLIKRKLIFKNYKDCLFDNETILRSQQRFKSYHHKVYIEGVNKIALSSDDDKRLQAFDGIETHTYGITNMMLKVFETKENVLKIQMINFDDYVSENKTEHNKNWPYVPDHPYRISIIGGSGSGKTNVLLNLIDSQPDIDKKYLYAKDPYEAK